MLPTIGTDRTDRDSEAVDSTDALDPARLSTGGAVIQRTLLTRFVDSASATRGYPEDSTDETNSLNLISFY
jgi:hypothetical protein